MTYYEEKRKELLEKTDKDVRIVVKKYNVKCSDSFIRAISEMILPDIK